MACEREGVKDGVYERKGESQENIRVKENEERKIREKR